MAIERNPWVHSRQRRAVELGLITAAAPAIGLTALLAVGALKLTDDSEKFFHEVERSLVPGRTFTMRKLGDPHSQSRAAQVCRKAMIDELPQAAAIVRGDMSFFGPRGASPQHVVNSFASVGRQNPELRADAQAAHAWQKAGWISSYAIVSHAGNLDALEEEARFQGGSELDANALVRLSLDVADYRHASFRYETGLLAKCVGMVRANYSYYVAEAMRPPKPTAPHQLLTSPATYI